MTRLRHVIATSGTMPWDPSGEPTSGVVGAVFGMTEPLAHDGYSVEIWGWNETRPARAYSWDGIKAWSSPQWHWAQFARWDVRWLAPVWWRGLTQSPVDVLHAHVDPNLLYAPKARVRLLHLHTPINEALPPAYLRLLRRADGVICCSDFIRKQFISASDYPAEQTYVVHNGADPGVFESADGAAQRREWGIEDADTVVLYAGAIVPEKGVHHLVQAFRQVQTLVPNAHLVIVGSARLWAMPGGNPAGDAYEAEVRGLAEGLNVRFAGSLPRGKMPAVFKAADVVAVPSVWDEPLALVVLEAMAAGKPVVASRTGGMTETVRHGDTGVLLRPGDEGQLAEALTTLATDKQLHSQMGTAARQRAKIFTWDAAARRLDEIYRELLARRTAFTAPDTLGKG